MTELSKHPGCTDRSATRASLPRRQGYEQCPRDCRQNSSRCARKRNLFGQQMVYTLKQAHWAAAGLASTVDEGGFLEMVWQCRSAHAKRRQLVRAPRQFQHDPASFLRWSLGWPVPAGSKSWSSAMYSVRCAMRDTRSLAKSAQLCATQWVKLGAKTIGFCRNPQPFKARRCRSLKMRLNAWSSPSHILCTRETEVGEYFGDSGILLQRWTGFSRFSPDSITVEII